MPRHNKTKQNEQRSKQRNKQTRKHRTIPNDAEDGQRVDWPQVTGGNAGWHRHCGKRFIASYEVKLMLSHVTNNVTPKEFPLENFNVSSHKNLFRDVLAIAVFIINKTEQQPKQMSFSKVHHFHIIEHYSALERKELLIQSTTWMKLSNIMLSDRSQPQVTFKWLHM